MSTDRITHIRVVAAVIEKKGRLLITQRRAEGSLGGLWEFPTGEVEESESDEAALRRELRERLGVSINVGEMLAHRTHCYDEYVVDLVLYEARLMPGHKPHPVRVDNVRWVTVAELENYRSSAADQGTTDHVVEIRRNGRTLGTA